MRVEHRIRAQLKRHARTGLVEASYLLHLPCRGADHALTYHEIGPATGDVSRVCTRSFREQIRFLADACEVLPPLASAREAAEHKAASKPRVRITIDDGHISALSIAAPILFKHNLPAAIFVPTDAIGLRDRLSTAHIRELSDCGLVIGSHSCSHRSMPTIPETEGHNEAIESRKILEDITGKRVTSFAYPFGTRTDFNAATDRILASAGYCRAFTSQHGPIEPSTPVLRTPRVKIEGQDSLASFSKIVLGAADTWRWVDRYLFWLQRGSHRRPVTDA